MESRISHNSKSRSPRESFAPASSIKFNRADFFQPLFALILLLRSCSCKNPWRCYIEVPLILNGNIITPIITYWDHTCTPNRLHLQEYLTPVQKKHLEDKVEVSTRWACVVSYRPLHSMCLQNFRLNMIVVLCTKYQ